MLLRYFFSVLTCFQCVCILAQGVFKAEANVGMSLSQIQGDRLAGFDKLGWTGGIGVYYPVSLLVDVGLEMSYTEKGSRGELLFDVPSNIRRTHLQYFEMPIVVRMNEWYIQKEGYYKVSAHVGVNNAYLFQGRSEIRNNFLVLVPADSFKSYEFGLLFGASYRFSRRLGITSRYHRALTRFYKSNNVNTGGLLNYYWTVRIDYSF